MYLTQPRALGEEGLVRWATPTQALSQALGSQHSSQGRVGSTLRSVLELQLIGNDKAMYPHLSQVSGMVTVNLQTTQL